MKVIEPALIVATVFYRSFQYHLVKLHLAVLTFGLTIVNHWPFSKRNCKWWAMVATFVKDSSQRGHIHHSEIIYVLEMEIMLSGIRFVNHYYRNHYQPVLNNHNQPCIHHWAILRSINSICQQSTSHFINQLLCTFIEHHQPPAIYWDWPWVEYYRLFLLTITYEPTII